MLLELKDVLQIGAMLGGLATLGVGLAQYRTAQHWRKKELVAGEAKAFFADPTVRLALRLIEWRQFEIEVPYADAPADQRQITVKPEILASALRSGPGGTPANEASHQKWIMERMEYFKPSEMYLREVFDHFLDGLDRFENFVASGLVEAGDVKPYLDYWFRMMTGENTRMGPQVQIALASYMKDNGYESVISLMRRCGYQPRTSA